MRLRRRDTAGGAGSLNAASPPAFALDDLQLREARARSAYIHASYHKQRLAKRGGRAVANTDAVSADLERAIDQFVAEGRHATSLTELAQAAGRIERLARMLEAAFELPQAEARALRLHREWQPLREQLA